MVSTVLACSFVYHIWHSGSHLIRRIFQRPTLAFCPLRFVAGGKKGFSTWVGTDFLDIYIKMFVHWWTEEEEKNIPSSIRSI